MAEYGEELTDREMELVSLVSTGITNREIAHQLSISVNTVKVHLRNVFTKLGAESRTEVTMMAVREGWVTVEGLEPVDEGEQEGVDGATEDIPTPLPPLPWLQRIALVAVGCLVVAVIIVAQIWGGRPLAGSGVALAPEPPVDGPPAPAPISTPAPGSPWQELAQMPTRRAYLAVTSVDRRILAIAGRTEDAVSGAVEIYDRGDDIWQRGAQKPTPVVYVASAAVDGRVYVPGGVGIDGRPLSIVEVYDVRGDTWDEVRALPVPRSAYALASYADKVYLFGGWDGEGYVQTTLIYDPAVDTWGTSSPMSEGRGFAAAAVLNDQIYVVGGYDGSRELRACEVYDPVSERWADCPPLMVGRGGLGLASLGGRLFAIGGGGWSSYLGFNEQYLPGQDAWSVVDTPLMNEWRSPGVTVVDSTIYAVGGYSGGYLGLNQAYEALPYRVFIPLSSQ